jgi:hypothetical protein
MKVGCHINPNGSCSTLVSSSTPVMLAIRGPDGKLKETLPGGVNTDLPRDLAHERNFMISIGGETRLIYPGDGGCFITPPNGTHEIFTAGFGFDDSKPVRLRVNGPPGPQTITVERQIRIDNASTGDSSPFHTDRLSATFTIVEPATPADFATKPVAPQPPPKSTEVPKKMPPVR